MKKAFRHPYWASEEGKEDKNSIQSWMAVCGIMGIGFAIGLIIDGFGGDVPFPSFLFFAVMGVLSLAILTSLTINSRIGKLKFILIRKGYITEADMGEENEKAQD